jgi:hypothetical protein
LTLDTGGPKREWLPKVLSHLLGTAIASGSFDADFPGIVAMWRAILISPRPGGTVGLSPMLPLRRLIEGNYLDAAEMSAHQSPPLDVVEAGAPHGPGEYGPWKMTCHGSGKHAAPRGTSVLCDRCADSAKLSSCP